MTDESQGGAPQEPTPEPPQASPPPNWNQPPAAGVADPHGLGPTSMGMAPHVAAALSYVFGWITGLIFFLSEKQNKFVRFHAMQSLVMSGAYFILYMVLGMMLFPMIMGSSLAMLGTLMMVLNLVGLAVLILWIVCIVQAATGKWFKLPLIGDLAAKWSGN